MVLFSSEFIQKIQFYFVASRDVEEVKTPGTLEISQSTVT